MTGHRLTGPHPAQRRVFAAGACARAAPGAVLHGHHRDPATTPRGEQRGDAACRGGDCRGVGRLDGDVGVLAGLKAGGRSAHGTSCPYKVCIRRCEGHWTAGLRHLGKDGHGAYPCPRRAQEVRARSLAGPWGCWWRGGGSNVQVKHMHKSPANQALARVRRTFKVRGFHHLAGLQLGSPTRSVYAWHPQIVQHRAALALHATKHISTLAHDDETAGANHRERGGGHFPPLWAPIKPPRWASAIRR